MNPCDAETLEALAADELTLEKSKATLAHVMGCEACRAELSLLREERSRFEARAHRHALSTQGADVATWNRVVATLAPATRRAPAPARWSVMGGSAIAAMVLAAIGWVGYAGVFHRRAADDTAIPVELKVTESAPGLTVAAHALTGTETVALADFDEGDWTIGLGSEPNVYVKCPDGIIEVNATSGAQAKLHVAVGDDGEMAAIDPAWRLTLREGGGALHVELSCTKEKCNHTPSLSIELAIPARSKLFLEAVTADIDIKDILGRKEVRTVSGAIEIDGSGDMELHTTSGAVELKAASGGDVRIETVSGDVSFTGACGAGCTRHVTTVSGDVSFDTEDTGSFLLHYKTISGELSGDLVEDQHARELRVGKGDGRVNVKTVSGNLDLRR